MTRMLSALKRLEARGVTEPIGAWLAAEATPLAATRVAAAPLVKSAAKRKRKRRPAVSPSPAAELAPVVNVGASTDDFPVVAVSELFAPVCFTEPLIAGELFYVDEAFPTDEPSANAPEVVAEELEPPLPAPVVESCEITALPGDAPLSEIAEIGSSHADPRSRFAPTAKRPQLVEVRQRLMPAAASPTLLEQLIGESAAVAEDAADADAAIETSADSATCADALAATAPAANGVESSSLIAEDFSHEMLAAIALLAGNKADEFAPADNDDHLAEDEIRYQVEAGEAAESEYLPSELSVVSHHTEPVATSGEEIASLQSEVADDQAEASIDISDISEPDATFLAPEQSAEPISTLGTSIDEFPQEAADAEDTSSQVIPLERMPKTSSAAAHEEVALAVEYGEDVVEDVQPVEEMVPLKVRFGDEPPPASRAETLAWQDLSVAAYAAEIAELAQRVDNDLKEAPAAGAVALLAAEYQPHVSDLALRLALSLTVAEKRVLLVDAGLPDRALSAGLELATDPGLAEVLKGRTTWEEAMRQSATRLLWVLPAGRIIPPPITAGDQRLATILGEMCHRFDYVIIDAGSAAEPMTPAVAAAAGAAYLIVRLGESDAEAAQSAVTQLTSAAVPLKGCIATNVPAE